MMRTDATRSFWLGTDRESRDMIREAAQCPSFQIQAIIEEISNEDARFSQDHFYQHHKDWAAATHPTIYRSIDKDIFVVLDRNGSVILCSVSRIFQRTFGAGTMAKVEDAIKKWSAIPLLPHPNTARHIADELIRRDHPELDMEKAATPQELEKGPPDTLLGMGPTPRQRFRADHVVMPRFKQALGLVSDVARLLVRTMAPEEYNECIETFRALPKPMRMSVSVPNRVTLFALGINTFTERHCDKTDVKNGFAALLPLGDYTALPSDSWYRGAASPSSTAPWSAAAVAAPPPETTQPPEKEDEDGEYGPCVEDDLDAEIPENGGWTEAQIHGSVYWDP
ncbi:hypothetical protein DL771_012039 [Monosporascus sp. 5C6A]|nr:hypothetical protein DL771_012039 [Monosporascus sp. 5C6A]